MPPIIAGVLSKNEKYAVVSLSNPRSKPPKMVSPDLEMAGKMAAAWKLPMTHASI